MVVPDLALPILRRIAEETPQKKSDIIGWFPEQPNAAEDAFGFAIECEAIVPIAGAGAEDPLTRWVISAELVLRFAAEASASGRSVMSNKQATAMSDGSDLPEDPGTTERTEALGQAAPLSASRDSVGTAV
jgi:hypothetical protein